MHYSIHPAVPADLQHLLQLIHLKAEFDGCPNAVTATADKLNNTLFTPQPMAHVLLAKTQSDTHSKEQNKGPSGPMPIGFASYHFTYSTFLAQPSLWLDDLFVMRDYRNQAIGARLIQQLCEIAERHGCGRIDWTVNIHNNAGIRFYERMGARLQTQVHLCRLNQEAIQQHVS